MSGALDLPCREPALGRRPLGTQTVLGVGTPFEVAGVVMQIGADLDGHGGQQGGQGRRRGESTGLEGR
jgi:hypothetical protein